MQQTTGFWHRLFRNLASLKLTVFIFLALAACSLIGTLLPQGLSPQELEANYSPGVAGWIEALGLNDLYHTGWFRLLLFFLCVNLVVCTIDRLPKTLKLLRHREEHLSRQKLEKFTNSFQFSTHLEWEQVLSRVGGFVTGHFAPVHPLDDPKGFGATAEKGRWSRLMVYVVHLSILVILVGALTGSLFGFKGFMNISEGSSSSEVTLYRGTQPVVLPFEVRCDSFKASFYDNGMPKEYRSDLSVIEQGKEMLKQTIRVNDPMTYGGVTFYQSSYGSSLKQAEVEFKDVSSGQSYTMTLPYRELRQIPGTQDQVQVVDYQQDMSRFGPAVAIMLFKGGQQPSGSWILVNMPEFHGNRIQNYQVKVLRADPVPFTGLQVKRDPGIWLVYIGFIAMLLGTGLTFYSSHRKLWIYVTRGNSSHHIILAGRASKNQVAFESEFNALCEELRNELKGREKRGNEDTK